MASTGQGLLASDEDGRTLMRSSSSIRVLQARALVWKSLYIAAKRCRWVALLMSTLTSAASPVIMWHLLKKFPEDLGANVWGLLMALIMPLMLNIAIQATLNSFITELATEKESKLKVLQELYGVPKWLYWFCWGVYFAILCIPCMIILLCSLWLLTPVIREADPVIVIIIFTSAFALQFGVAALASVFFDTLQSAVRTTSLLSSLSFMIFLLGTFVTKYKILTFLLNLLPFNTVLNSLSALMWLEAGYHCDGRTCTAGLTWSTFWADDVCLTLLEKGPPPGGECPEHMRQEIIPAAPSVIFMIVDVFLLVGLAWYVEQLRHQGDKKNYLFCLFPSYMAPRRWPASDASHSNNSALAIQNLRKVFKGKAVVDDLSLTVSTGEIFALLGHNGAGKTTAINCITGLLPLDGGDVWVDGWNIRHATHQARMRLSVCPQDNAFWNEFSLENHLQFFGRLRGLDGPLCQERMDSLITGFGLHEKRHDKCQVLSGGQMRRLWAATALIGQTPIAFLDEPTSGMDPSSRRELWEVCMAERRAGRTILLTTHYLDEADILASRKAILSKGKVQASGTSKDLREQLGLGYDLRVEVQSDCDCEEVAKLVNSCVPTAAASAFSREDTGRVVTLKFPLPFREVDKFGPLLTELESRMDGGNVVNYTLGATTLEDVFMTLGLMAEEQEREEESQPLQPVNEVRDDNVPEGNADIAEPGQNLLVIDSFNRNSLELPNAKALAIVHLLTLWRDRPTFLAMVWMPLLFLGLNVYQSMEIGQLNNSIVPLAFSVQITTLCLILAKARAKKVMHVMISQGLSLKSFWAGSLAAHYLILLPVALALPVCIGYVHRDKEQWYLPLLFLEGIIYPLILLQNAHIVSLYAGSAEQAARVLPISNMLLAFIPVWIEDMAFRSAGEIGKEWVMVAKVFHVVMSAVNPFYGFPGMILVSTSNLLLQEPWLLIVPLLLSPLLLIGQGIWLCCLDVRGRPPGRAKIFSDCDNRLKDEDVLAEEQAVHSSDAQPPGGDEAARVEGLYHTFRQKEFMARGPATETPAVRGVSLSVKKGQCFGLLGPNGAGKTTIMGLLTGDVPQATSGRVFVAGHNVQTGAGRRQASMEIGVCPQVDPLWDPLTGRDHLRFYGQLKGVPEAMVDTAADSLLSGVGLLDAANKPAGEYSGGMKRKLSLCIALIGRSQLAILDEPSTGVDAMSKRTMWRLLKDGCQEQTVIVTTHSMEEAESLCSTVAIQVCGQLRCLGTPLHIKNKYGSDYRLECLGEEGPDASAEDWVKDVKDFVANRVSADAVVLESGLFRCLFQLPPLKRTIGFTLGRVYTLLGENAARLGIREYSLTQPTLEQVFLRLAKEQEEQQDKRPTAQPSAVGTIEMSSPQGEVLS